ncbi:hypothetical protein BHE74_00026884 [Ensete ventricosum]|nr:hypothetical protein BHE74_00026884 [Ensete ventricosum]RZS04031.1 hypothetical protein BHM03_00034297 [Ensete ventricosum]
MQRQMRHCQRWMGCRRGNNSGGRRGEAGEGATSMVEMVEATIEEKATTAAEGDGAIDSWEEKKEGSGGKQVEQWLRRARQGRWVRDGKKVISVAEEGATKSEGGRCSCVGCNNEVAAEGVGDEKQGSSDCGRVEQQGRQLGEEWLATTIEEESNTAVEKVGWKLLGSGRGRAAATTGKEEGKSNKTNFVPLFWTVTQSKLGSNKRVRQYTPDRGYFHTAISYAVVRNLDPPLGQCLYFESSAPS